MDGRIERQRSEILFFDGRKGDPVEGEVIEYSNGYALCTTKEARATLEQFRAALEKAYPQYEFNAGGSNGCGFWIVGGTLKDPLTGPDATWEDLGRGFSEHEPDYSEGGS